MFIHVYHSAVFTQTPMLLTTVTLISNKNLLNLFLKGRFETVSQSVDQNGLKLRPSQMQGPQVCSARPSQYNVCKHN